MTCRALPVALVAAVITLSACEIPHFQGPQIQNPPPGFFLQPETFQRRRMFPDLDVTFHSAWVHTDIGGVSIIYVNGHPGSLTLDDVTGAREGVLAAATDPDVSFSEIEALTIDGRQAWGWSEEIASSSRGLVDVTYHAVIVYDTISFAIAFTSGEPNFKGPAPDTLRTIISSFAIGQTTWNKPLIAIVMGGFLFLIAVMRTRAKERADRLRGINLVKIPRKEDEGHDNGEPNDPRPSPAPESA